MDPARQQHARWRHRAPGLLLLVGVGLLLPGCASTPPAPPEHPWEQLFSGLDRRDAESFDAVRVGQDLVRLQALFAEAASLRHDVLKLSRQLTFHPGPYLSQSDTAEVGRVLARTRNLIDALQDLGLFYRDRVGPDAETETRGHVLGLAASLMAYDVRAFFVSELMDRAARDWILNAAFRVLDVPGGSFDALFEAATDPELIERVHQVWALSSWARASQESALARLLADEPAYRDLARQADAAFADFRVRTQYILSESAHVSPAVRNRLRHSSMGRFTRWVESNAAEDMYALRGAVFTDVARIPIPQGHVATFSDAQIHELLGHMRPGDILLTFTAGHMSNIFLPGNFKHGLLFLGSPEQRSAAGMNDAFLERFAASPTQAETLRQRVRVGDTQEGDAANLMEALAEGVRFSSLAHVLRATATRAVILRPQVSEAERSLALAQALVQIGAPYDFKFDFEDPTYLCCTELVYRALQGKGHIDFHFAKTRGLWVLNADDIVRYALRDTDERAFSIVAYVEADPSDKAHAALLRFGPDARARLENMFEVAADGSSVMRSSARP